MLAGCRPEPATQRAAASPADVTAQIEEMLHASARSWNAGDLDAFLDDYASSPRTSFAGATGVIYGIDEIRARYEQTFWAPGAARDSLSFDILEVRALEADHALALGRYILTNPASGAVVSTGYFSLVLERQDEGWKIIHDHTSQAAGASPSPPDTR